MSEVIGVIKNANEVRKYHEDCLATILTTIYDIIQWGLSPLGAWRARLENNRITEYFEKIRSELKTDTGKYFTDFIESEVGKDFVLRQMEFATKNSQSEKLKLARKVFIGAITKENIDYTEPDLYLRILDELADADFLVLADLLVKFKSTQILSGENMKDYDIKIPHLIRLAKTGLLIQAQLEGTFLPPRYDDSRGLELAKPNFQLSSLFQGFAEFIKDN